MCNRFFDSNYLIIKIKQIQKEVEIKIKRIDSEVEAKLKQLVKDKEVVIRLALSFGWLAIIMICFFFTIFLLSDLFKFVSYLKKKYYNRVNKKIIHELSANKEDQRERRSVVRRVIEKEKKLLIHFNHYSKKKKSETK
jgi:flagellar biosynthesis component FlhA